MHSSSPVAVPGDAVRQQVGLDQRLQYAHEAVVEEVEEVLVRGDVEQDRWAFYPGLTPAQGVDVQCCLIKGQGGNVNQS